MDFIIAFCQRPISLSSTTAILDTHDFISLCIFPRTCCKGQIGTPPCVISNWLCKYRKMDVNLLLIGHCPVGWHICTVGIVHMRPISSRMLSIIGKCSISISAGKFVLHLSSTLNAFVPSNTIFRGRRMKISSNNAFIPAVINSWGKSFEPL